MMERFRNGPASRRLLITLFLAVSAAVLFSAKQSGFYQDIELLSVGELAPTFALDRLDGYRQKLADMRGAVVWIIFGRTDNAETQIQLDEARNVAQAVKDWDLRILFIAQSQSEAELQDYVSKKGCAAAVMIDKGGRIARIFNAQDWPTSYLMDKTGRIRYAARGLVRSGNDRFNELLGELLRSGMRNAPRTE